MYFSRLTDRAKKAIDLAIDSAKELGHDIMGSEHILLGLIKEKDGIAAKALIDLGITENIITEAIIEIEGKEDKKVDEILISPRGKKILELSTIIANKVDSIYIGTEHMLVGIIKEGESIATRIMMDIGVEPQKLYSELDKVFSQDTYTNDYNNSYDNNNDVSNKNDDINNTPTLKLS